MSFCPVPASCLSPDPRARLGRYPAKSLVALAAAVGCVALPSAAQAATPSRVVPAIPVCSKVSASEVSSIVGYTVPAPTEYTNTYVVDKKLNISATSTSCGFTVAATLDNPLASKTVYLDSEVFNKAVSEATLKAAETSEQEKVAREEKINHFKVSFSDYSGLGVTAVYYKITASLNIPGIPVGVTLPKGMTLPKVFAFAYSGIATLQGKQSYAASVNNGTISQSKLAALVRLAMKL
jgi:hypothetical protein